MRRRDDDNDDVSGVAEDGEVVRRSILLLDGSRDHQLSDHRNGYHVDQKIEDVRQRAREQWIADMTSAWKRPSARAHDAAEPYAGTRLLPPRRDEPDDPGERLRGHLRTEENEEHQARRDRAWLDYKESLGRAWQTLNQTNPNNAAEVERLRRMVTNEPR